MTNDQALWRVRFVYEDGSVYHESRFQSLDRALDYFESVRSSGGVLLDVRNAGEREFQLLYSRKGD